MILVTGMLRCGTTLVEKLLANHPDVSLLAQPFPFLFLDAKRAFLQSIGRGGDPYPLGDLFLETGFTNADFTRFLATYAPSRDALLDSFDRMAGYSGQRTRFPAEHVRAVVNALKPGDFAATLEQLYRELGHRESARWFGGKDNLCEEFLPYLLDRGAACTVIVRDPRDMLASLNHGRGEEFGGKAKPTLFNLRHWRKSVAFALHLQDHPRFVWMRYEDVVADPVAELNRVTSILQIAPFTPQMFADGIKDQDGTPWEGNSSHATARGLDASSVGAYRRVLPLEVTAFTEAVCYPEMRHLGYHVTLPREQIADTIAAFTEPYDVRENLRDAFADPARREEEQNRTDYLFDDVGVMLRKAAER
jgi:hypothetical protein